MLPGTYGSARAAGPDGAEVVVGVKAEVETADAPLGGGAGARDGKGGPLPEGPGDEEPGPGDWLRLTLEIPGYREDDALVVFLCAMLREALVAGRAGAAVRRRLWGGARWRWRLYVDVHSPFPTSHVRRQSLESATFYAISDADRCKIILLAPPLAYPVPLLSLATHLALLTTRLPRPVSRWAEDPTFDDDWAAAAPLYPAPHRPPITLLAAVVGATVLMDPVREELAVADAIFAVAVAGGGDSAGGADGPAELLAVRTVDPPARAAQGAAVPGVVDVAAGMEGPPADGETGGDREGEGWWRPPRGGTKPGLMVKVVEVCLGKGGVAADVLKSLEGFEGTVLGEGS